MLRCSVHPHLQAYVHEKGKQMCCRLTNQFDLRSCIFIHHISALAGQIHRILFKVLWSTQWEIKYCMVMNVTGACHTKWYWCSSNFYLVSTCVIVKLHSSGHSRPTLCAYTTCRQWEKCLFVKLYLKENYININKLSSWAEEALVGALDLGIFSRVQKVTELERCCVTVHAVHILRMYFFFQTF